MRYSFGSETTTSKSLVETILSLSDLAGNTLVFVLEQIEEESINPTNKVDSRGVYVEHDNSCSKPFNTKAVKELVKSGLVLVHPESENGTYFLSTNKDVFNAAVSCGFHMSTEEA